MSDKVGFAVRINNPYMVPASMSKRTLLAVKTEESQYKGVLKDQRGDVRPGQGLCGFRPEMPTRLFVLPGQQCEVSVFDKFPTERDFTFYVMMNSALGTHVDLLLPFLPVDDAVLNSEMRLGFDGALSEANRYWSRVPSTAATFDVPEGYISQAIMRNLQFTRGDRRARPEHRGLLAFDRGLGVRTRSLADTDGHDDESPRPDGSPQHAGEVPESLQGPTGFHRRPRSELQAPSGLPEQPEDADVDRLAERSRRTALGDFRTRTPDRRPERSPTSTCRRSSKRASSSRIFATRPTTTEFSGSCRRP